MIYQLKITLQRTHPLIWRRVLVHKDMTLSEFHEVIQIAFDWLGYHLHCYEARTTNGERLYRKNIQIGMKGEQLEGLMEYDFDENEEKLSNWLMKEKDKLMYVYDFGDDWRHEIVLEKILSPEEGRTYPYCVKALRASAEEDSGGFVEEAEQVDPNELKASINVELEYLSEELSLIPLELHQRVKDENEWSRLLERTAEYSELAPWRWLDDNQIFAVEHPGTGEMVYCSVLGAMGEEFGLATYIGWDGLQYMKSILDGSIASSDILATNHGIVLSLCDSEEITEQDEQIMKQEGFSFHGENKWPMFRSFQPGYYPWFLTEDEVIAFAIIVERVIGICKRAKDDLYIKEFHETDNCFAQIIEEQHGDILLKDTYISTANDYVSAKPSELLVSELEVQKFKSVRKRFNTPLEIGFFYAPTPVQENPSVRPYIPTVFVVAERKTGRVIFHDMYHSDNREQAIQLSFMKLLEQLQAIPREIWVESEAHLILKPIFNKLKINVLQLERLPIINDLKDEMHGQINPSI